MNYKKLSKDLDRLLIIKINSAEEVKPNERKPVLGWDIESTRNIAIICYYSDGYWYEYEGAGYKCDVTHWAYCDKPNLKEVV